MYESDNIEILNKLFKTVHLIPEKNDYMLFNWVLNEAKQSGDSPLKTAGSICFYLGMDKWKYKADILQLLMSTKPYHGLN